MIGGDVVSSLIALQISGGGGGVVVSGNNVCQIADGLEKLAELSVGAWKLKLCIIPGNAIIPFDISMHKYTANDNKSYAYMYKFGKYDYPALALYSEDKIIAVCTGASNTHIQRVNEVYYNISNGAPPDLQTPLEYKIEYDWKLPLLDVQWYYDTNNVSCSAIYNCKVTRTERDGAGYNTYDFETTFPLNAEFVSGSYNSCYINSELSEDRIKENLVDYQKYITTYGI